MSAKDQSKLHQFGKQVLPRIFPGYVLETSWSRSMLGDSTRRRSSCRKMLKTTYSRSQVEQSSCLDQVFPRTTSIQDHRARGEEHKDVFQEKSDGSQPLDTLTVDGEARNDFGTITENFF